MAGNDTLNAEQEGFAIALANKITKGHADSKTVSFFYDWEKRVEAQGHYSRLDPFNVLRTSGKRQDYKNRHDALVGTLHMLHAPRFQTVTRDVEQDNTAAARVYMSNHHMHLPTTNLPYAMDAQGNLKNTGGNWATGPVGNAIADVGSGVKKGAESVGGGIGGWLGKNVVLIVIVVVLIVALKK